MAAGYVADGKGHGQNGQTEGQGHSQKADADIGKGRRQNRASAAAEDQPECSNPFRDKSLYHT